MNIHNTHVQTTTLLSGLTNHFDLQKVRLIKCTADIPAVGTDATAGRALYYSDTPFGQEAQQVQLGNEKIILGVISASGCTGTGKLNILTSGSVSGATSLGTELVDDIVVNNATAALCTVHSTGATGATASHQGYLSLKTEGITVGTSGKAKLTLLTLAP